jgi:hypothetical protein
MNHPAMDSHFDELTTKYQWSPSAYALACGAEFHCSYCGRYMLDEYELFRFSQTDHLLPKSRYRHLEHETSNHVNSCLLCNMLKGHWDPSIPEERDGLKSAPSLTPDQRNALICRTIEYLADRLTQKRNEFEAMASLIRPRFPRRGGSQ